jgi:tripartite-type tricarboxylate transporter receptor subunit TctC
MIVSTARCLAASAALALACIGGTANAQDFPNKPVHIAVPFLPGGGCDGQIRLLSQRLGEELKQPIIVENKNLGANGTIGAAAVARQPADGYTLVCVSTGSLLIPPMLSKNVGFKLSDFVPVVALSRQPMIVVVPGNSPITNVRELIAAAKVPGANVSYASAGIGSQAHMSGEMFNAISGTNFTHVPYKGGGGVIQALLGGEVTVGYTPAILSSTRSPFLPNVPTMKEAGPAGMELIAWFGLMAPAGTPKPVINLIQEKIAKIMNEPAMKVKFENMVAEPWPATSDEFAAAIRTDSALYERVIRERGIKGE